jgi:hypothetical protein
MSANECYAYFGLNGFPGSPEEISAKLGLMPTEVALAGTPIGRSGKKREVSRWCIESRLPRDAQVEFEAHVKDVLVQLTPCFEVAASLSRQHDGVMELVGYFHDSYPGLWLDSATMQQLAALGVRLDCDFYYLAE